MFDTGLVLAIAHHLAVFLLVAILATELALLRPGIADNRLIALAKIDMTYGGVAALVIVIGILRVIFGGIGWEYYVGNWAFWAKMLSFALVGLASLPPTLAIARWRRARATPSDADVNAARRFLLIEAGVLVFIPVFAAAMARGYGG